MGDKQNMSSCSISSCPLTSSRPFTPSRLIRSSRPPHPSICAPLPPHTQHTPAPPPLLPTTSSLSWCSTCLCTLAPCVPLAAPSSRACCCACVVTSTSDMTFFCTCACTAIRTLSSSSFFCWYAFSKKSALVILYSEGSGKPTSDLYLLLLLVFHQ